MLNKTLFFKFFFGERSPSCYHEEAFWDFKTKKLKIVKFKIIFIRCE